MADKKAPNKVTRHPLFLRVAGEYSPFLITTTILGGVAVAAALAAAARLIQKAIVYWRFYPANLWLTRLLWIVIFAAVPLLSILAVQAVNDAKRDGTLQVIRTTPVSDNELRLIFTAGIVYSLRVPLAALIALLPALIVTSRHLMIMAAIRSSIPPLQMFLLNIFPQQSGWVWMRLLRGSFGVTPEFIGWTLAIPGIYLLTIMTAVWVALKSSTAKPLDARPWLIGWAVPLLLMVVANGLSWLVELPDFLVFRVIDYALAALIASSIYVVDVAILRAWRRT